jgi:hypothetical protein
MYAKKRATTTINDETRRPYPIFGAGAEVRHGPKGCAQSGTRLALMETFAMALVGAGSVATAEIAVADGNLGPISVMTLCTDCDTAHQLRLFRSEPHRPVRFLGQHR